MTSSDCREHTLYQNVNFVQPLNFTINCLWLWAQVYLTVYQKELFSTYVYVANHVSTQTTDKQHQFQPWQVGVYFFQHWWFLVAKVKITAKLAHPSMTQSKWKTNTQPLLEREVLRVQEYILYIPHSVYECGEDRSVYVCGSEVNRGSKLGSYICTNDMNSWIHASQLYTGPFM